MRVLSLLDIRGDLQHMRLALDDDAPPPDGVMSVGFEGPTTLLISAVINKLVPSALRNSTVWFWTTKLTGKISGCPPTLVASRPSDSPDSSCQHSSPDRIVIGSPAADISDPNVHTRGAHGKPPTRSAARCCGLALVDGRLQDAAKRVPRSALDSAEC